MKISSGSWRKCKRQGGGATATSRLNQPTVVVTIGGGSGAKDQLLADAR